MSSDEDRKDLFANPNDMSDDESSGEEVDPKRIYNAQAMEQKLQEIKLGENIPWIEFPVISSGFVHEKVSAEDDFEREVSFYKQAIAGCQEAQVRLESLGVKYKRPDDYFAEMYKSDAHMAKVRQSLLDQQKRIEAVEERRRQRELKRFGKKVQVEKEQTRAKQKKSEVEAIKKWRKDQKRNSSTGDGSEQKDIDVVLAEAKKKSTEPQKKGKTQKRKRKDSQYGFGGPQKRAKKNTADSAADFGAFSSFKNRSVDADLHPLVPKFAQGKGRKSRVSAPQKVNRIGKGKKF